MLERTCFVALLALSACKSAAQPTPATPATPAPPVATSGCAAEGKEWFVPGGDETRITKGCHTPCEHQACPSGELCSSVITNPCGETEDGQTLACMQASTQTMLCLPG